MDRLVRFLRGRRRFLAALLAYLGASWLAVRLVQLLTESRGSNALAVEATIVILAIGFVALAWIASRRLPPEASTHELAAIWFADIANYSELMARDEARVMSLVELFRAAARRTVRERDGRIVKFIGDEVLAQFKSTHSAVEAALDLHREYTQVVAETWGDPPPLRIGVHVGDVRTTPDGDLYGDGVNVASRIERAATPGQVLVSADVWHQLRQNPAFAFGPVEHPPFKGVADIAVYSVEASVRTAVGEPREERRALPWSRRKLTTLAVGGIAGAIALIYVLSRVSGPDLTGSATATAAPPGIMVLPFQVSGEELEGWSFGMVDLLSTNLDGVTGMRTIDSRTVHARWDKTFGSEESPELERIIALARGSGARYGIVGRAVSIGSTVRLSADVYDLRGKGRIGAATVEGVPDSLFLLVDRLSIELVRIIPEEEGSRRGSIGLARITTGSIDALKAYLEGQELFRRAEYNSAFERYERATAIDSTFALAYYMQALSAGWGGLEESAELLANAARHSDRLPPREALIVQGILALHSGSLDSRDLVELAVRRYPDDHEAWAALGEVYFHLGPQLLINPMTTDSAFERAVEIDPSIGADYQHLIDHAFGLHADAERARRLVSAYERLAPQSREALLYRTGLQLAYGSPADRRAGRATLDTLPGASVRFIQRNLFWHPDLLELSEAILVSVSPSDPGRAFALAKVRFARGRVEEAVQEIVKAEVPEEMGLATLYLASVWGMPIDAAQVDRVLARFDVARASPEVSFFVGSFAVDRERRRDAEDARARLATLADSLRSAGEPYRADFAAGAEKALAGYMRWRLDGRPREALGTLLEAQREATGYLDSPLLANSAIRRWVAGLALELGDLPTAERFLRSFWGLRESFATSADLELARVLDRQERFAEAEDRYARFHTAWSAADPELAPRLREARDRLAAIRAARASRD